MESIIYIVIVLVILSISAKFSTLKLWQILVYCIAFIIISTIMKDYVINSHSNEVQRYITSVKAHNAVAILISIEFILLMLQTFSDSNRPDKYSTKLKVVLYNIKTIIDKIEKYYISLLSIPILYYIDTQLVYNLTGMNFTLICIIGGVFFSVLTFMISYILRLALPNFDIKKDFNMAINLIMFCTALYSTNSDVLIYQANASNQISLSTYILGLGSIILIFGIGYFYNRIKTTKS